MKAPVVAIDTATPEMVTACDGFGGPSRKTLRYGNGWGQMQPGSWQSAGASCVSAALAQCRTRLNFAPIFISGLRPPAPRALDNQQGPRDAAGRLLDVDTQAALCSSGETPFSLPYRRIYQEVSIIFFAARSREP